METEKRGIPSSFPPVDHPTVFFFLFAFRSRCKKKTKKKTVIGLRDVNLLGLPCLCPQGFCHIVSHPTPPSNPPIVTSSFFFLLQCDFILFVPCSVTIWPFQHPPPCWVASSYMFYDGIHTIISGEGLAQHGWRHVAENERVMPLSQT